MNGTRQLIEVVLNNYPRPIPPALASNHLASSVETCEQCHSRAIDSGSPLRVIAKFKDDEANTPIQTVLVMNVGGNRAGGIHGAHMGPGIEIRYRTGDAKRQVIPEVEYRNTAKGETTTYTTAGAKTAGTRQFLMECADCHNRQGHAFETPDEAVNGAIANGQISAALPFAHKTGVSILKANAEIPGAFAAFYRQNYPQVISQHGSDIDRAGKTLFTLYQRNVFPDLGVKWGTYPNNLGHADNAGCFRCHDESHLTAKKQTITQDCGVCHQVLAVEETAPTVLKALGIARP
jgi:mono/diheme cytochrome c family protein